MTRPKMTRGQKWGTAAISSVGASVAIFFAAIKPGGGPSFEPEWFCLAGLPASTESVKVLVNRGYMAGYSEFHRNPAWVCYRVVRVDGTDAPERPGSFKRDKRTKARIVSDDYTNTGYDRGHMAPSYAIGLCYGDKAQRETFLMSNVVPQSPDMNRGPWKALEQKVVDLAQQYGVVWVTTGPVYDGPVVTLWNVRVPDSCFKVLTWGETNAVAFLMSQDANGPFGGYTTTVDRVEALTGLDFMAGLPDDIEFAMESQISSMVSE